MRLLVSTTVALVLTGAIPAAAGRYYTITDLGTLGGPKSRALAMNASGVVVGTSTDATSRFRAFIHDGTAIHDLGTLTGADDLHVPSLASATGINDAGEVVGQSYVLTGAGYRTHAFLWRGGPLLDLGAPPNGNSGAAAIDQAGRVGGWREDVADTVRGFVHDGTVHELPTLDGGEARVRAMAGSADGAIVGFALRDGLRHAVVWTAGGIADLGTLGDGGCRGHCEAPESEAAGVSAAGEVVGWAVVGTADHAFVWRGGPLVDLHDAGRAAATRALAISDRGEIVGSLTATIRDVDHGALWGPDGLVDLNDLVPAGSDWVLGPARAVNDAGQIAGSGWRDDGWERAYRLDPHESVCGNGTVEPGEACDDGNTASGDACAGDCGAVTLCGNGLLDPGETCDAGAANGSDGCCSAACALVDADGDGVCDARDLCSSGAALGKPKLVGTPSRARGATLRVRLTGMLAVPAGTVVDPAASGLRVVVAAADGTRLVDGTAAAGWLRRGRAFRWLGAEGGLVRAVVQPGRAGRVRVTADLQLPRDGAPATASVLLGRDADVGMCAEARFRGGCGVRGHGRAFQCSAAGSAR
jgi:probable HAF family extracellular repeat protein/cysteine-rich repeat protein